MRYGVSQYNANVYNALLYSVACQVDVTAAVGQVNRLRNVTAQATVSVNASVSITAVCTTSATVSCIVTGNVGPYVRVRHTSATATCTVLGSAGTTAVCVTSANSQAQVSITARPTVSWAGRAAVDVTVDVTVSAAATCFTEVSASVSVSLAVARTRVKYAAFGQALVIRAANNEGLRVPSSGVLNLLQGSLEWVVEPFTVTASATRYLFDGAGTANKNLTVQLNTSGNVYVTYGTGTDTVTLTSSVTIQGDGGNRIGVGWDDTGIVVMLDGQVAASSLQKPALEFGPNVYIGCSSSQTNSLDGKLDEFRVSSKKRSAAEFLAAYEAGILGAPLAWDIDTTYLLPCNGDLNLPSDRQGVWVSPVQNASNATDYASLAVTWLETLPTNTAISCQVRTSADGVTWSAWYNQVNGQYATAPSNKYSQVRFILQELSNAGTPTLSSATANYEGSPSASSLLTGLSVAKRYSFAQLQDYLIICNGVDLPKKYDGTTITDITAAPRAALVCTYKNRVFMAKTSTDKSRIYFSDILNVDSWPAVNFIDVNPSDGDEIADNIPLPTALLIVKQHNVYFLQGYSPQTFQVVNAGRGGTISSWGAVWTPYGIFVVDREGVWATDFRTQKRLTVDIQKIWDGLNQRRLDNAACLYYQDMLITAVPNGADNNNSLVLVYDLQQKAWATWTGWYSSCFATFWERGKWTYLFGDSRSGNVWQIGGNETFTAVVETKHYPLSSEGTTNRLKWADVTLGGGSSAASVPVSFVADGTLSAAKTLNVPANSEGPTYRLYPPAFAKNLGLRVEMPSTSPGLTLLGAEIAFFPRAVRPQRVV